MKHYRRRPRAEPQHARQARGGHLRRPHDGEHQRRRRGGSPEARRDRRVLPVERRGRARHLHPAVPGPGGRDTAERRRLHLLLGRPARRHRRRRRSPSSRCTSRTSTSGRRSATCRIDRAGVPRPDLRLRRVQLHPGPAGAGRGTPRSLARP
ncbi:MAG: hypothetical protein MZV63_60125 [Marinilabiliales bacterium]|nr:hypothetical protein [Marinilabiliales bacterium]